MPDLHSFTVRMTRRITFSSGHRYWLNSKSEAENKTLFGPWSSPFNHGHNYVLDVSVEGLVDSETGMVVNIKIIDDVLRDRVKRQFDQKSINDEIEAFRDQSPSVENLLLYLRTHLIGMHPATQLVALKLEETPLLYGEWDASMKENYVTITRVYEFAASHRLHVPSLSQQSNLELFGKCNNVAGHGHNYMLEVTVGGLPDHATGMIVDINEMDRIVNERIIDRYDHKNLSVDVPEFVDKNPTSEVVAQTIFSKLREHLPVKLERVRLHETARNIFEVSAE
ncbi:MAG: 6-carboxytetrahydropterin synthase [Armatimonadetes bacterium]|nr:6-carboxytetrahydropterin synthase [Armatimonadota bacterium]